MYNFDIFPSVKLEDILLREIDLSNDAPDYLEYMQNMVMGEFLSADNIPSSLSGAISELAYWKSLFKRKASIYWAIALKDSNKLIGTAGFNSISFINMRAEISYDLNPKFWGNSYMYSAIMAILEFGFKEIGINRIQATVMTSNLRSKRLLDRCGFKEEGIMHQYGIIEGVPRDYLMFAKVNSEKN